MEANDREQTESPSETIFPRFGAGKLSDRVSSDLEQRILSGEFLPGQRLPTESELGQLFGVSRSVVRDGLRSLVARGLIEVRQGRGIAVTEVSHDAYGEALVVLLVRAGLTMRSITEARAVIETGTARRAAEHATDADLDAMQEHLDTFTEAVEASRWDRAADAHMRFHMALIRANHLLALEIILSPMEEIILLSALPPSVAEVEFWDVPSHAPILEALRRRNPDEAEIAVAEHFRRTLAGERFHDFEESTFRQAAIDAIGPVSGSNSMAAHLARLLADLN